MSLIKDIGNILVEHSLGELGVDLFLSQMPEMPDEAAALYETGGGEYDAVSELHTGGLSVRARAGDYESAYNKMALIANELKAIGDENYFLTELNEGIEKDGTKYLRIKPISEPYPIGRDAKERIEFAQSFTRTFSKI